MTKLITRFFLIGLFLPLAVFAQTKWEEGTHYEVINKQASAKPQVKEVFSFWCPHCYTFESIAKQIKAQLPDSVKFVKAHVNFLGGASRDTQEQATYALLAATAMKDEARLTDALFAAIHRDRNYPTNLDEIIGIYVKAGGDGEKMRKLINSFGIKSQFRKNEKLIQGFRSVPAFVVNNKYQATFTRDMTPDTFIELINWLLKQK